MRTITTRTDVYEWDELTEEAREKAIERRREENYDFVLDHQKEWLEGLGKVTPEFIKKFCGIKRYGAVKPGAYDILSCLTLMDPGTFEDFCGEYGYSDDSRKAEATYKAVKSEFLNIERLFDAQEIEGLGDLW